MPSHLFVHACNVYHLCASLLGLMELITDIVANTYSTDKHACLFTMIHTRYAYTVTHSRFMHKHSIGLRK